MISIYLLLDFFKNQGVFDTPSTQSTENEGRVGRAGMPYPPTFVAINPYN